MREIDEKIIEVTIQFNDGTVSAPKYGDKVTLSGLRIKMSVLGGTIGNQGQMTCMIQGLTKEMMTRLTSTGFIRQENKLHKIMVAAGNRKDALTTIFEGNIDSAFANINQPVSEFQITSFSAMNAQLTPVGASSYRDSVSVSQIMADFAKEASLKFVDKGVKKQLSNPYFSGDTYSKIKKCANAAHIAYNTDMGTLTIWEMGKEKKGNLTVSTEPGNIPQLIGVPKYTGGGVTIRTLFCPDFVFNEKFELKSKDLDLLNGEWQPLSIVHDLECFMPNGAWYTTVEANRGL